MTGLLTWLMSGAIGAVSVFAAPHIAAQTLAPPSPLARKSWDLTQLLTAMSQNKRTRARFVERQFLALLDEPIDASGELHFEAPAKLEKRTLKPRPELLAVNGDQLRIERPGLTRTMSLQQLPEVAPLIESLRATLNGNRQALEQIFDVQFEGPREGWRMTLSPRRQDPTPLVRRIVIGGAGGQLQQIEIEQHDGDRSVMRILDSQ